MDNENESNSESQICLVSFRKHWAKAQIDGPMQTIARYDDVAKLLITIGGFLLAVLAQGYSVMLKGTAAMNTAQTRGISKVVFYSMLAFFVCAAFVCLPQPKRSAFQVLTLKRDEDLKCLISNWCNNIGRVINIKRT